jgi:lysophospholipase L1-like esterase
MDRAVPRDAQYFPDGIHPSGADGYDRIANIWYGALQPVLATNGEQTVSTAKQAKP